VKHTHKKDVWKNVSAALFHKTTVYVILPVSYK